MASTTDQTLVDAAYANMILAKAVLDKAADAYHPWKNKSENNLRRATLLSNLAQAQQVYDLAVRKYNGLIGGMSEDDHIQSEADLLLAQAQFSVAQETYEILKQGPDPDQIAYAEAQVANAQARLNLVEASGSSVEPFILAQAQVDAARANLEILRARVDKMTIRAPYDGVISKVQASQGEYAIPGELMVELLDTTGWLIETKNVGELQISNLRRSMGM
jgi:multidrug resistance efflux pump